MKCEKCGKPNTEVITINVKPTNIFLNIATFGGFKVRICQSCVSKMFKQFHKGL